MKTVTPDNLNLAVQTITGIAILVGLGFVVWELKQNREATTSQLTIDGIQFAAQQDLALFGEEPSEVLAKACFNPDQLTDADLFRLNGIYTLRLYSVDRLISLTERGSFYEDGYWKVYADAHFALIFNTSVGRNYWLRFRESWPRDELVKYGDELLAKVGDPSCRKRFGGWKQANNESDR
jgi:hypothetical protein